MPESKERALTVDPSEFRTIIGHFATGVTVITAASGGKLHGMTAQSVTSLSLEPVMLLVCIDKTSHAHDVITAGGAFAVNILGAHQEEVSRVFAKKSEPEPGTLRGEKFRIGRSGAPILEDCLAYIDCTVRQVFDGGDHSIFLGDVVDEAVVAEVKPLLFYRSGYHALA
jgi:flavin reductase (DIM6/NTAB) family NADH-FMN oxidoreductase RutF